MWALANPIFASPDEPSHMVRAQGIIKGDFKEPYLTDGLPVSQVDCMSFKWDVTADCMNMKWGNPDTLQGSSTDTYPPLFHILAGIPTLFAHGLTGAYTMRIWLALLCSSMLAWAGTLLWLRRPHFWTLGGLVAATTPTVVFTSGTVNPSGLTAAFSALIWASGLNLTLPTAGTVGRASRVTFIISVILFPLLRRDALAWELLILLILGTTLGRDRIKELCKDKLVLGSLFLTLANMIFVWFAWSGTATDSFVSNSAVHGGGSWTSALGSLYTKILEMLGWFGWLDSPMTSETFVLLLCTLSSVIGIAALGGRKGEARTVVISFITLMSVPIIIGAVRYPYVQGRYLFPIWIGCMLLSGQALTTSQLPLKLSKRLFTLVMTCLTVVQFFAFAQNLRRYAVGRSGTWKFYENSNWHPPMMSNLSSLLLVVVALTCSITFGHLIIKSMSASSSSPSLVN